MAVAFVRSHTAVADKASSSTTVNLQISTATTVGNVLVARILFDNAATASKPTIASAASIARAAGETSSWVFLGAARSTSTSAGAFASGEMWAIRTSVVWPVATYAVTLDTAVTQKATLVQEFSGVLAVTRCTPGAAYSTTTTAAIALSNGAPQIPAQAGDLALGFIFGSNVAAAQAGTSDSTGGVPWSTPVGFGTTGGNVATNNYGIAQYKIPTAGVYPSVTNSAAMTAGNGAINIVLQQYVDPAITQAASQFYADGTETGAVDAYDIANAGGGGLEFSSAAYTKVGQSFLGNGQKLVRAQCALGRQNTPNGTITAELYAHTGTFGTSSLPTGSALATSTAIASTSVVGIPVKWYDFNFDGTFTLVNGTQYVLVISTTNTASSTLSLFYDNTSPTHSGNMSNIHVSTGVWATSASDMCFGVFGPSNALAAQDAAPTISVDAGDVNLQLRTRLQSTSAVAVDPWNDFQLQWEKNASGSWADVVPGPGVVDRYDSSNVGNYYSMDTAGYLFGQSFIGNGTRLSQAKFWLGREGVPTGTLTSNLYAHTGLFGTSSNYTGAVLATSTAVSESTISGFGWVTFTFDESYQMQRGVPYVITIKRNTTDNVKYIYVGNDNSSPTHPGNLTAINVPTPSQDLAFEVSGVGGGSGVLPYVSPNLTDAAVTTNRLTGGSGTFTAGEISETGLVTDLGWAGNNYTELLYSLTLKKSDLSNNDTLRFRVLRNGATTGLTYTQTPTINITKTPLAITQAAYQFYADGTETASTALAAQDTAPTIDVTTGDVNLQLRTRLQSTTAAPIDATDDFQLQLEKNASGTWNNVSGGQLGIADSYGTENYTSSGWSLHSVVPEEGQSFLGSGRPLARAGFYLNRSSGLPNGVLSAKLYAHTGTFGVDGKPTGAPLATSTTTVAPASLPIISPNAMVYFDFDSTFTLVVGVPYFIVLTTTTTTLEATAYVYVSTNNTTPTHAGNGCRLVSGVWTVVSADFIFYVYDDIGVSLPYSSTYLTDGAATTERLTVFTDSYEGTGSTYSLGNTATAMGQSFKGKGLPIIAAQFRMNNSAGTTGTVLAKIYAHTGTFGSSGKPTGTALATSDVVNVSTITTGMTNLWVNFPFSGGNQITLTNGTPYYIILEHTSSLNLGVQASFYNGTHEGNFARYTTLWVSEATDDATFKITSSAGTGTFTPGKVSEDGLVDNLGWSGNNYTELLYSLTLKKAALANGDTLRFRVLRNGVTTYLTYSKYPTITISSTQVVGSGKPKVWTGSAFVEKPGKVWNGSAWVEKPWKRWNGSAWVNV